MDPAIFEFTPGSTPLLVSIPHAGTSLPEPIRHRFTFAAQALPDTDWHLDRLYDFADDLGAARLVANYSRYVVDLNRPPDDQRLYQTATTGLFPTVQFDGTAIYVDGTEPDEAEQARRLESFYRPYHDQLIAGLREIKREFGFAVLFDAHSIRSSVPRLFDGALPDLNVGTHDGFSADPTLESQLVQICQRSHFSTVLNGRFKGGYITRHYGQPNEQIHAVQLEMPLRLYMREDETFAFDDQRAMQLWPTLREWVEVLIGWRPA